MEMYTTPASTLNSFMYPLVLDKVVPQLSFGTVALSCFGNIRGKF